MCCRSSREIQASRQLARVRSAYVQVDLDAWVPYLDQAATTAAAINAMRTPTTNPFTLAMETLTGVTFTVEDIRGNMLDGLSETVKQFNSLWHNNASVAFEVRWLAQLALMHDSCFGCCARVRGCC